MINYSLNMGSKKIINLFLVLSLLCCNYPARAGSFDSFFDSSLSGSTNLNTETIIEPTPDPTPTVESTVIDTHSIIVAEDPRVAELKINKATLEGKRNQLQERLNELNAVNPKTLDVIGEITSVEELIEILNKQIKDIQDEIDRIQNGGATVEATPTVEPIVINANATSVAELEINKATREARVEYLRVWLNELNAVNSEVLDVIIERESIEKLIEILDNQIKGIQNEIDKIQNGGATVEPTSEPTSEPTPIITELTVEPTPEARCGDGSLNSTALEECDDGNTVDLDGCSSICQIESLASEERSTPSPEVTVEVSPTPIEMPGLEESPTPTLPVCRNGIVESPEECDDGNTEDGDGCSNDCYVEPSPTPMPQHTCGDGNVEFPEQCDDGNVENGDGCSSTCLSLIDNNECTKGFELIVQAGDDSPKNVLIPENIENGTLDIQEISGCPFQDSQIDPENQITTVIDNGACGELSPETVVLNEEVLNVKETIKNYYQGIDPSAGPKLCQLLEMNPTIIDNFIITNIKTPIATRQALTILDSMERDLLLSKWSKWQPHMTSPVQESRSNGVTVYAASRQNQLSGGTVPPERLSVVAGVGLGNTRRFTYDLFDLQAIMIDPAIALMDLAGGNLYPDYLDVDSPNMNGVGGRRNMGDLPYSWEYRIDNMVITQYMPFYHASFQGFYTAGLAHHLTMTEMNSLDLAHSTLANNWNTFKAKYADPDMPPLPPPPPGLSHTQTPIKSPWEPNNSFTSLNAADSMNVEKYALLIKPFLGEQNELITFNADVNLIKHVLRTTYEIPEENISIAVTPGEVENKLFGLPISSIRTKARISKANGKRVQLLVYVTGHGVVGEPELLVMDAPPIANIMSKEGGGNLYVALSAMGMGEIPNTANFLAESTLKRWLEFELQYDQFTNQQLNAQFNVIDDVFIIFDTCVSGAGTI